MLRGFVKPVRLVGRVLGSGSDISLAASEIVPDFLYICHILILPECYEGVRLPVEIERTATGSIDSLWRK